jgi:hypothetical protein
MKRLLSVGGWYLWQTLDDADGWVVKENTATYKERFQMWVGNGAFFFDGRGDEHTPQFLGYFERHILWRKFKKMKANKVAIRLAKLVAM